MITQISFIRIISPIASVSSYLQCHNVKDHNIYQINLATLYPMMGSRESQLFFVLSYLLAKLN